MKDNPHTQKYQFEMPTSILSAEDRMRGLLLDIRNIEKQLGDKVRYSKEGKQLTRAEYQSWYSRIRASLVYKLTEYSELRAWIRRRRRELAARDMEIEDPADPTQILMATRDILRSVMDGDHDPSDIGDLHEVIEQYLTHVA
jgi:hypothetical protein